MRNDLNTDAATKNEDTGGHRREAAAAAEEQDDSEVDDVEDKKLDVVHEWLGTERECLAKTLRQTDSGISWDDVY